jgi:hypothetical protein
MHTRYERNIEKVKVTGHWNFYLKRLLTFDAWLKRLYKRNLRTKVALKNR